MVIETHSQDNHVSLKMTYQFTIPENTQPTCIASSETTTVVNSFAALHETNMHKFIYI